MFGFRCQTAENYRCCLLHLLTHWHLSSRERVLAGGGQLQWPARRQPAVSVTWKYGFRIRFAIAGMSHSFSPVENTEKLLVFFAARDSSHADRNNCFFCSQLHCRILMATGFNRFLGQSYIVSRSRKLIPTIYFCFQMSHSWQAQPRIFTRAWCTCHTV